CTLSDSAVQRIADAVIQSIKGYIDTLVLAETHIEGEGDTHSETLVEGEGERETELDLDPLPEADSETGVTEGEEEREREEEGEGEGGGTAESLVETLPQTESDIIIEVEREDERETESGEAEEVEREDETDTGPSAETDSVGEEERVFFQDHPYQYVDGTMYTDTVPYFRGNTVYVYKEKSYDWSGHMTGAVTYDIVVPPGDFVSWLMIPSSPIDASFGVWKAPKEWQEPQEEPERLLDNSDDYVMCHRREESVTCESIKSSLDSYPVSFEVTGIKPDEYAYLPITVSTRDPYIRPSFTIQQWESLTAIHRAHVERDLALDAVELEYIAKRREEGMRFVSGSGNVVFSQEPLSEQGDGKPYHIVRVAFPPCDEPTTWTMECKEGTTLFKWEYGSMLGDSGTIDFTRDGDEVTVSQFSSEIGELVTTVLTDGTEAGIGELIYSIVLWNLRSPPMGCRIQ
ncbi:hypothetical protein KIPB_009854, partial [Kipferlia bialata]